MTNNLEGRDILHGAQFTRSELEQIMALTDDIRRRLEGERSLELLRGYVMGALFFEPSTRTRLSFEAAMHRMGGAVIGFASAGVSSSAKGESLADTIRTVDQYADVIVMRHPEIGSAAAAAEVAEAPIINGGDGAGQHPTQALLDLYTLRAELGGRIDGRTLALVGDLRHGRTVHAGVELYKHYDVELIFVAPEALRMPEEITRRLRQEGRTVTETTDLEVALRGADVVYMTRIQKERFADPAEYARLSGSYVLSRELIERTNPEVTVLHPLPRVDEIDTDVDPLPGAAYFRQAQNGMYVRMALLGLVLGVV